MNFILRKILLTRPYSWVCVVLISILANVLSNGKFILDAVLFFDVFVAIFIWCTATTIVEYFHKKTDGRGLTHPLIPLISTIILIIIVIYRNFIAIVPLFVIILADIAYSMKIKSKILGQLSFMLRGILEVCTFLIIMFFHGNYSTAEFIPLLIVIYFLTNSRNLIGDIRDVEFDEYTFPKKYGTALSYVISILFIFLSIAIIADLSVTFPLILFLFTFLFSRNAYTLHRIFVAVTPFFYMNYVLSFLGESLIFINILFIAVILNFTYPVVPRKSNPKTTQVYNYTHK